jgi:LacI family transcriptional regulator
MANQESGHISLREIAERAKVTRMTVSLALRGHPSIPAATQRRIQAIARKLGHRRDPVVSELMSNLRKMTLKRNTETIAVVTQSVGGVNWRKFATASGYGKGAAKRAAEHGYSLSEFHLGDSGLSARRLSDILVARGIQGVLIMPTLDPQGSFELEMDFRQFSMATIAYSLHSPQLHRCSTHHFSGAYEAFSQLAKLGYRKIGLVLSAEMDQRSGHNWIGGFFSASFQHSDIHTAQPLVQDLITSTKFQTWFRKQRPDAIVHVGPEPIIEWLRQCSQTVSPSVGYANLDLAFAPAGASGIDQQTESIGAGALDLVLEGMRNHERGIPGNQKNLMLEGVWRAGSTTPTQRS